MSKTGRYVKPAEAVYSPSAVVTLTVSTRAAGGLERSNHVPTVFHRAYTSASRRVKGVWTPPKRQEWSDPQKCIDFIHGWTKLGQRTYVFSPVASNALTLLQFWEHIDAVGARWQGATGTPFSAVGPADPDDVYTFSRLVLRGLPDIVTYRRHGKSYCWTSLRQYITAEESALARSVGYTWPARSGGGTETGVSSRHPQDVCDLWMLAVQRLCDWWVRVQGGPWGLTAGQLAERYFRKRVTPKALSTHQDDAARILERQAIWGGRASAWFLGDVGARGEGTSYRVPPPPPSEYPAIPGPLLQLDVRSMYPALLASEVYPVKLLSCRMGYTPKELGELCKDMGVIARVRLWTDQPEYPARYRDRVVYPTGLIETTLAGPELAYAVACGDVVSVGLTAVYQLGRPFERMSSSLIDLRESARADGDGCFELFIKLLSNSFAGKLAQRKGRWSERPEATLPVRWGEETIRDTAAGVTRRFRAQAGLAWEYLPDEPAGRPLGFAFAYLTAYGRRLMSDIRATLPAKSVVSQDTDGLWTLTNLQTIQRLSHTRMGNTRGRLRAVCQVPAGRWYSPKHYWTPNGWTLAGMHLPSRSSDGLSFRDTYTTNPISGSCSYPPLHVWEHYRSVSLSTMPVDGEVQDDGWIIPLHWPARDCQDPPSC